MRAGSKYQRKISAKHGKGRPSRNWVWWMERPSEMRARLEREGGERVAESEEAV